MRASAIRVFVDRLDLAVPFYRDVLGLPVQFESPEAAGFDAGAVQLIVERGDADERGRPLVGRFTGLSFGVEDARAEHAKLQSMGVRTLGAPELQAWGGTLVTFEDPAGNELQLVEYPR